MRLGLVIPLVVSLLIIGLFLSVRPQRCESLEVSEFSVEVPYLEALVLLGEKSSLERLVSAGGVRVTDREWESFEFGRHSKFSSWEASGRCRFKAKSVSGDFSGEMLFVQVVHATKAGMDVRSEMSLPCGHVKSHETGIRIENSRPVAVRVENKLVYERSLPFWLSGTLRSRVEEYNKSRVRALSEEIRSIMEGHAAKTAHQ